MRDRDTPRGSASSPALLLLLAIAACGEERNAETAAAERKDWPPDTVLVLNGRPILAEEVDRVGSDFALLEPQDTPLQLRRLAVSNVFIPLIAAQGIDADRRARAQALAQEYAAAIAKGELAPGPLAGPMEIEREGSFSGLGFAMWRTAVQLGVGEWSAILETPGSFHLIRVKSREEGSLPALTRFRIGAIDFPYLDAETAKADLEAALDRSRLTILDPTWRDAVPADWRYRLHVESP
jgi:hypothetical protein